MAPALNDTQPVLADKVAALRRPDAYPEPPRAVTAIETHMAWVFLAGAYAYKMKKPIRRPGMDYATLERRRRDAEAEVLLNRRFAPGVYLGVASLSKQKDGSLALEGSGDAVEWLVKMRRLPRDRMLDALLRRGRLPADCLRRAAGRLARYYAGAPGACLSAVRYRRDLLASVARETRRLKRPAYRLPRLLIDDVSGALAGYLDRRGTVVEARAAHVVDGHGDLRPEHVCLVEEPVVIDCIAFSRRLRLVDPVDELGFLALECERLGAPIVEAIVFDRYRDATGDNPDAGLLAFYKSRQALIRARLSIWHLDDETDRPDFWREQAESYLRWAARYARRL